MQLPSSKTGLPIEIFNNVQQGKAKRGYIPIFARTDSQKLRLPTCMAEAGLGPQAFSPGSDFTTKAAASLGGGNKSTIVILCRLF